VIFFKKKESATSISRVLSSSIINLLLISQQASNDLPLGKDEQPLYSDILGLSTHKVYPFDLSLNQIVSSYLTFSPLPFARRLFSVALAVKFLQLAYPLGSMMLCVARTFLSNFTSSDRTMPHLSFFLFFLSCVCCSFSCYFIKKYFSYT